MATPDNFYEANETLLTNLGDEIKSYRKKMNLTQQKLAEKCGLHYKFIQTLETKKRNISISAFVQLAKGLGVSPDVLLKTISSKKL